MAITMHAHIVSAEGSIFDGTVEQVYAPGRMGELGIYPRHTQLLTQLKPGEVKLVIEEGKEQFFYVSGGILEIQPHVVTILADTAMRAKDIDTAAAEEAIKRAEEVMEGSHQGEFDYARAQIELAKAVAQLKTVEDLRRKMKGGRGRG
ncbi:MAG: F0F1 ATP synthase subunit epsilon [Gammaproteobacteria bacterium]|nr:F0F1 ATP synthase subunit epsilon [Gammaproteobacteria bacterium]